MKAFCAGVAVVTAGNAAALTPAAYAWVDDRCWRLAGATGVTG